MSALICPTGLQSNEININSTTISSSSGITQCGILVLECENSSLLALTSSLTSLWDTSVTSESISQHSSGRSVDVRLFFQDIWSDSGHLQRAAEVPPRLRGNTRSWRQEETCQVGAAPREWSAAFGQRSMGPNKTHFWTIEWKYKLYIPRFLHTSFLHPGSRCRAIRASRCLQTSSSWRRWCRCFLHPSPSTTWRSSLRSGSAALDE